MPRFAPELYIGAPDSGDYFTAVRPPEAVGVLQTLSIREGQDESRPFQRAAPSSLSGQFLLPNDERPYQPGQLLIARVTQDDTTEDWFRGTVTRPDYDTKRTSRSLVTVPAIGTFDRLRRTISRASVSNRSYGQAIGDVLTAAAWPTAAEFRQIPAADFSETLTNWEVSNQEALPVLEAILNTAGPPAKMIPLHNGGLQIIRDIGTISGAHVFDNYDLYDDYDLSYDDRSLINSVTLDGTEYTSSTSSSSEKRDLPSSFSVLDGLQSGNRAALAERIFDAYEFGLSYLVFTLTLNNRRVYDRARRLRLGGVIAVDLEGARQSGYIAQLEWTWRQTVARVRVGMVVKGNIVGVRFPPVYVYGGFKITEGIHETGYTPSGGGTPTPAAAFNWRFDTLAAFETYFTIPQGSNSGHWEADTNAGSTSTGNTGPGTNNADDFVFAKASPGSTVNSTREANGIAELASGEIDDFTGRDVIIRYVAAGRFGDGTGGGISVEGRATGGAWTEIAFLHGWAYAGTRNQGDTVTDNDGVDFDVAQDGGWRDATVNIPDTYDEMRLAPTYTATGQRARQDIALHSIRSA